MANGATNFIEARQRLGEVYPLQERNQLFRNVSGKTYDNITDVAGALRDHSVTRGASFGDLDNDGFSDILIIIIAAPPLFSIVSNLKPIGLGVSLQTVDQSTSKLQCRIVAELGDNRTLIHSPNRWKLSIHQRPSCHLRPGHYADDVTLRVHWSDDSVETFKTYRLITTSL